MDANLKAEWIAALRSGKFTQAKGVLESQTGHNCCLGVLCRIKGLEAVSGYENYDTPGVFFKYGISSGSDVILPHDFAEVVGFEPVDPVNVNRSGSFRVNLCNVEAIREGYGLSWIESLADLNDHGFTFDQIADVINYFF